MRRERFRRFWPAIAVVAFATVTIESASAHDKGCDGNPVPGGIKWDCCGKADEHRLKPEQISRGRNEEYVVSFEEYVRNSSGQGAAPQRSLQLYLLRERVGDRRRQSRALSKDAGGLLLPHAA
jgi:hypothetical protein